MEDLETERPRVPIALPPLRLLDTAFALAFDLPRPLPLPRATMPGRPPPVGGLSLLRMEGGRRGKLASNLEPTSWEEARVFTRAPLMFYSMRVWLHV